MIKSYTLSPNRKSESDASLVSIFAPVRSELQAVENQLLGWSKASSQSMIAMARQTISRPGKLIRPGLFLLITGHFGYQEKDRIETAATIEAIHVASLIHDDIIDGSALRRGKATALKAFGPEFSLLFGDYLFIKSIARALDFKNKKIARILAEASGQMIEGEIEELSQSYNLKISENTYFKIIRKKTASLFQAIGELAAELAGVPPDLSQELKAYGFNLGLVYQIVDDLLDLQGDSDETGKARFSDWQEGRITLPVIRALKTWPEKQKKAAASWLKKEKKEQKLPADSFNNFLSELEKSGAISSSFRTADKLADKAKNYLAKLETSPYRESLVKLVDFVLKRKN